MKLLASLVVALAAVSSPAQNVIVNEIMYHSSSTNVLDQWFEIYNADTNAVNLSGWKITKGVNYAFATNTMLAAGGYLVVASDRATFTNKYPGVTNFVAGWTGKLSHGGDQIQIEDAVGQAIDSVSYAPEGEWATRRMSEFDQFGKQGWEWFAGHDGNGKSLELINRNLSNNYGHNWASSTVNNGTPGQVNSVVRTNIAPILTDVGHLPLIPTPADPVTITARVIDERIGDGLAATITGVRGQARCGAIAGALDDGICGPVGI